LSGFLDKKRDRNRTGTGRFGPVPVWFRVSFFFWFGCFFRVKTESNRICSPLMKMGCSSTFSLIFHKPTSLSNLKNKMWTKLSYELNHLISKLNKKNSLTKSQDIKLLTQVFLRKKKILIFLYFNFGPCIFNISQIIKSNYFVMKSSTNSIVGIFLRSR